MYKRKTHSAAELSEACRRASLSRKNRRGGRPRTNPDTRPPRSIKVGARHYEMLTKIAAAHRLTLKYAAECLIDVLINGTNKPIPPHPQFAIDEA